MPATSSKYKKKHAQKVSTRGRIAKMQNLNSWTTHGLATFTTNTIAPITIAQRAWDAEVLRSDPLVSPPSNGDGVGVDGCGVEGDCGVEVGEGVGVVLGGALDGEGVEGSGVGDGVCASARMTPAEVAAFAQADVSSFAKVVMDAP